jgi:hypothetical protein
MTFPLRGYDAQTMQYETQDQHQHASIPDEAARKLGSAQPDTDPFDAVDGAQAGIPADVVAPQQRPVEVRPTEGIPSETQATEFATPEARPHDVRPREVFPTEFR